MASGITFSGFNNIDFSSILNAIMAQERLPVRTLELQQSALEAQKTAFSTLASKLSALETAAETLSTSSGFGGRTAASSNSSAVSVSATSAAAAGTYDIVVTDLARVQTTAATSTLPDKDTTVVASGGSVIINGVPVTVTVPATLQDLADAINANEDVAAMASVVSPTPGSYQLVLTGKSTGSAGAFTVESTLTGGTGVTFTDTDGDGISGDSIEDNAQAAGNATFTVNGVAISSATNAIEDVIPGVSFQLLKKDPTATVSLTVNADQQAAKDQVNAFVTAFNDLMTFAKDESTKAANGSANTIGRDALLRGLRNELRAALNAPYATGGAYSYVSQVGLGFDRSGSLTFDETKFDEATESGNTELLKLFAGSGGVDGVFTALTSRMGQYTEAGGLIPDAKERIDEQLTSVGARISSMEARLAIRREALNKEFIATDTAMKSLNNSIQSLSSLSNQYRLF